jgi:hypothetical protein
MNENEFLTTLDEINDLPCTFAKAIFRGCCRCDYSHKLLLAEREIIACKSRNAQRRCEEVIPLLRSRAMFALKLTQIEGKLPHGKEVKVQCGALLSLRQQMENLEVLPAKVDDIDILLTQAIKQYHTIESFPYSQMMTAISHFSVRPQKN